MYARVFTAQLQAGKLDEAIHIVQDSIIPAAKAQKGFQQLFFLSDSNTGKCHIVSLWASEADRAASEASGFLREQLAKLAAVVAGPPSTERFVVSVHG